MGAPLARYVPALQELAYVEPKEEPLTQAQLERMEREALRKEQEEEFESLKKELVRGAADSRRAGEMQLLCCQLLLLTGHAPTTEQVQEVHVVVDPRNLGGTIYSREWLFISTRDRYE